MIENIKILLSFIFLFGGLYGYGQDPNDSLRNPYSPYYLTDLSMRTVGDLMVADSIQPIDNNITFAILDSVRNGNAETRNYFLPAFNVIINKSDGALSEVIGIYCIGSMNNNPNELLRWLSEGKLSASKETVSQYIAYELVMSQNPYKDKITLINTIRKDAKNTEITNFANKFITQLNKDFENLFKE